MLEDLYRRRLATGLADAEYFTSQSRGFYAMALAADGQQTQALTEFRGAVPVLLAEARRNANAEQGGNVAKQMRLVWILEAYIKLLLDLRDSPLLKDAGIDAVDETFRLADVARGSSVQRALAESAARATPGDPALADLARREQDAQQRFVTLSDLLNRLLSMPPEQQLPKIIGELKRDIEILRVNRDQLKQEVGQRFPDYADLIDPKPATVAEVQRALGNDEALISIYAGAERSYVWAVFKSGKAAFAAVDLTDARIAESVTQLRKALDVGEVSLAMFPRFDLARSHELYAKLLQPVESGWREAKSLIVVPHKALAQLPFAVLTTAPFSAPVKAKPFEEYRQAPWLVRRAALSQLPSVSTLLALRRVPAASPGRKEFAGFGDPLFSREMALAANDAGSVARGVKLRNLSIAKVATAPVAAVFDAPSALRTATVANSSRLAQLARLPDTAEEIQSIAQALKADPGGDVFLGRAASEKNVKSGQLANRRIVMFATHGLVPGDLDGLTQPALALSAPEVTGNADEDGLLTMEEVLGLKLNADWVVLSACNTAAGDGAGSEAVSGLGKAFFYAGARSLLVSNWPVETVSARLLTTKLFEQQAANSNLSRAEALRGTMLELIDRGESGSATSGGSFAYAHPTFWAPFSLVGDGGR
jgi:CHAT domain-containing protein